MNKVKAINDVRNRAGVGVMKAKEALAEMDWNVDAAVDLIESTKKDSPERPTGYAGIFQYNHNGRISSTVVLGCNTDFVGKTEEFKALGKELAQQIVGTNPRSIEELLSEPALIAPDQTISERVDSVRRKTQETIKIIRFSREQV